MTPNTLAAIRDRTHSQSVAADPGPKPLLEGPQPRAALIGLWAFVTIPFLTLAAAVPWAWGWGLSWIDVTIFAVLYPVTGLGITVGFHRYLTHGSFKATRWLRTTLAAAGSLEGPPSVWVADHRRHHAFSDRDGDPHSPWRYGESVGGLTRGLLYAHVGWMLNRENSNRARFAPDLLADRDIRRIDRLFPAFVAVTLLGPAAIGGLATWPGMAPCRRSSGAPWSACQPPSRRRLRARQQSAEPFLYLHVANGFPSLAVVRPPVLGLE